MKRTRQTQMCFPFHDISFRRRFEALLFLNCIQLTLATDLCFLLSFVRMDSIFPSNTAVCRH